MADGKELKPKSFRIDDETANKFKEISASIGGNQQDTMQLLINAYFMQTQKAGLVEHKASIEEFERYVTSIINMYTQSLQANHDMKESVMQEFEALLKSKDTTIQDLQEKLTVAKQLEEESARSAKAYADENAQLKSAIDSLKKEYNAKMDDMQTMLADKDNLNKALTDSCNDLKAKVESMRDSSEQLQVISRELEQLKAEHSTVMKEKSELEKLMEKEQAAHNKAVADMQQHENDLLERQKEQAQIMVDKAVLEVEKKYLDQIEKLKADKQSEVEKYQQRYLELLEKSAN